MFFSFIKIHCAGFFIYICILETSKEPKFDMSWSRTVLNLDKHALSLVNASRKKKKSSIKLV